MILTVIPMVILAAILKRKSGWLKRESCKKYIINGIRSLNPSK